MSFSLKAILYNMFGRSRRYRRLHAEAFVNNKQVSQSEGITYMPRDIY